MRTILTAVILCCGLATAAAQAPLRFEVASVRPNTNVEMRASTASPPDGLTYVNMSLADTIFNAYGIRAFQVVGLPGWTIPANYDITAKADRPISQAERMLMLRTLLAERFNLKAALDTREQTVYVLTRQRPDRLGSGLKPRPDCAKAAGACKEDGVGARTGGFIRLAAAGMPQVIRMLSLMLNQVVRDESTLEGVFNVDLSWRPDSAPTDDVRPSIFTAVEEQLGLKLTPQRRPAEVLVIESIERATPQ